MLFVKFYNPFFTSLYEENFKRKIQSQTALTLSSERYKQLLDLQKHVAKVAASFQQLRGVYQYGEENNSINQLEGNLAAVLNNIARAYNNENSGYPFPNVITGINNQFALLKHSFEETNCFSNTGAVANILSNSLVVLSGAVSFAYASFMLHGAALGTVCLGMGLAFLSMALLAAAVYSIYVDARFLGDKQLKEIEELIQLLSPAPLEGQPDAPVEGAPHAAAP